MQLINLIVQGTPVVDHPYSKNTESAEINDTAKPFALIEPMYSKHSKESEKNPSEVVVNRAIEIASVRTFVHAGNKEQINNPAHKKSPRVNSQMIPEMGRP